MACSISGAGTQRSIRVWPSALPSPSVFDFTNEEPVAKQVGECPSAEVYAATHLAGAEAPCLGADVHGFQITDQFIDASDFEILAEDRLDTLRLFVHDEELTVPEFVAEGQIRPFRRLTAD
jgi:hypothetical protein